MARLGSAGHACASVALSLLLRAALLPLPQAIPHPGSRPTAPHALAFGDRCENLDSELSSGLCCCSDTGLVAYGQQAHGHSLCRDGAACSGSTKGFCSQSMTNHSRMVYIRKMATKDFCRKQCPCCVGEATLVERRLAGEANQTIKQQPQEEDICASMGRQQCQICKCCPIPLPFPVYHEDEDEAGEEGVPMPAGISDSLGGAIGPGANHAPGTFILGEGLLAALGHRAEEVAPNMSARHIILMLNASAKLGWTPSTSLLHALGDRARTVVPQMSAQNVASILNAFVSLHKEPRQQLLVSLGEHLETCAQDLSPAQLANVLQAYGVMQRIPKDSLLEKLGQGVSHAAPRMTPGTVAEVLNAYASLQRVPNNTVVAALGKRVEEVAPKMNAHNTSAALHAYSLLGRASGIFVEESVIAALGQRAEEVAPEMNAQDVAQVLESYVGLWEQLEDAVMNAVQGNADTTSEHGAGVLSAYTKVWKLEQMKKLGASLLDALAQRLKDLAPDMDSDGISLALKAYAHIKVQPGDEVIDALSDRVVALATGLPAPTVASLFHSFFRLDRRPKDVLLVALEDRTTDIANNLTANGVAYVLGAYAWMARVPSSKPALLNALGNQTVKVSSHMDAEEMASSLDACTVLWQSPNKQMVRGLETRGEEVARDMNARDVSQTFHALGHLGDPVSPPLLSALSERIANKVGPSMTANHVASVLNACASLGVRPEKQMLAVLTKKAEDVAPDMDAQEVSDVLSAYAKLWMEHTEDEMASLNSEQSTNDTSQALTFAIMSEMGKSLVASLGNRVEQVIGNLTATNVANVLDSYAKLGEPPQETLMQALSQRAKVVVDTMSAKDVSMTLSAYAAIKQEMAEVDAGGAIRL